MVRYGKSVEYKRGYLIPTPSHTRYCMCFSLSTPSSGTARGTSKQTIYAVPRLASDKGGDGSIKPRPQSNRAYDSPVRLMYIRTRLTVCLRGFTGSISVGPRDVATLRLSRVVSGTSRQLSWTFCFLPLRRLATDLLIGLRLR